MLKCRTQDFTDLDVRYARDNSRERCTLELEELTGRIIRCAMTVHSTLGSGFIESVYQKALAFELARAGIDFECEKPLVVIYEGIVVGEFSADMVIEGAIIVENKAVARLTPVHEVQLVNYLTATGLDIGLLLNFGAQSLDFRRKTRVFKLPRTLEEE